MAKWQDRKCLGLLCDVRVRETVDKVIRTSIEHWGNVDVIAKYKSISWFL
jgi:NADP-dependent 3-hydroxy acid dehydrogenase YdfG